MKKVLFIFMVLVALVACKKKTNEPEPTNPGEQRTIKILNGEDGELTITENRYQLVMLEGATFDEVTFTSSDTTIVEVFENIICATKPGIAIVTATLNSDAKVTATLKVKVISILNSIEFTDMVYLDPIYDWQGQNTVIITKRKKSAEMGDNNRILNFDHAGDVADINSWVDEVLPNNFYFLEVKDGDSIGVVQDSIYITRALLVSKDAYYDADGNFVVNQVGATMEFTDSYFHYGDNNFIVGMRTVVDDVLNVGDQYAKTGASLKPMPGYIQKTHFNTTNYLAYYSILLDNGSAGRDQFPFYNDYDSYFNINYTYPDESSAKGYSISTLDYGQVTSGEFYVLEKFLQAVSYIKLDAKIMEDYIVLGLKTTTNEQTGRVDFVQPLELAQMTDHTFLKGQRPTDAKAHKPVSNAALKRMSRVKGTMCTITRMALGK